MFFLDEKDYIENNRKLSKVKTTYTQGGNVQTNNPFKKVLYRIGRKMTFWYVNPFGDAQNEFNQTVCTSLNYTATTLERLNKTVLSLQNQLKSTNTKLTSVVQQNNALKSQVNKLQKDETIIVDSFSNSIGKTNKDVNDYIRQVEPDKRKNACYSDIKEISESYYLESVSSLVDQQAKNVDLDSWGITYKNNIKKELVNVTTNSNKNIIAVVCKGYIESKGIEAVRSEAFELYKLLKRSSIYNVKFICIERTVTAPVYDGDMLYIPEQNAGKYLKVINPILCVFCESTAGIINVDKRSMMLNRAIFKLSGQNPVRNVGEKTLEELKHLNDFGLHKYLVQSKQAYDIMVESGFHEPTISYPIYSNSKIYPRKRVLDRDNFTVGFASSPMLSGQMAFRGMELLTKTITAMKDVKFEILWRYDTAPIPDEIANAENCTIKTGKYDMQQFYSEIDAVIIPYESIDCNHACSLSGVEAMQNGIPVVCTNVSGISEVVDYCSMGEVVSTDVEDMVKAIYSVRDNYSMYISARNKQRLDQRLDNSDIVDIIEREAEKVTLGRLVTLEKWDKDLKAKGKYLVKGHEQMKEYYQNQEIADKYTQHRFTSIALKCFDFIERQNISIIIEDKFGDDNRVNILDVACGDGRITQQCIKHGSCTSMDSSQAMLNIVQDRFKDEENQPNTKLCDFITEDFDGKYDVITCFRYIRHFEYSTRKLLYKKYAEHLEDNGILIFDVPNIDFELQLKGINGWGNYNIYDVFWSKQSIIEELSNNGFKVKYIIPTGQKLMSNLPDKVKKLPMTWTVGVVKKLV